MTEESLMPWANTPDNTSWSTDELFSARLLYSATWEPPALRQYHIIEIRWRCLLAAYDLPFKAPVET